MRVDAAAVAAAAGSAAAAARADFAGAGVTSVGDLGPCTSLTRLELADNAGLTSLAGLETAPALKHVVAARCGLRAAAPRCAQLRVLDVSGCASLRTLDVSGCPRLAAVVAADVPGLRIVGAAACAELATLVVKGCAMTAADLAALLATTPALQKLSAARNAVAGGVDLSPCPQLAEVRLGHNALTVLPAGLGARLRVLDVGHNPGLGPSLTAVVGALAAGAHPWLRQLTLRGTRAAEGAGDGYRDAVVGGLPTVRVLDDKRVEGDNAARGAKKRAAPPAAAPPATKKAATVPPKATTTAAPPPTEPKSGRAAAKDAKKKAKKAARRDAGAPRRYDPDAGLGVPSAKPPATAAPVEPAPAPAPEPPAPAPQRVAHGAAAVAVINVQRKRQPAPKTAAAPAVAASGVKTGAAAAAALMQAQAVEDVAEW